MGKRNHSTDGNLNALSLYKLFVFFNLMSSMSNREDLKEEHKENVWENNPVNLSPDNKTYIPVNDDSLMESYKNAFTGDLEIHEKTNIPEYTEADNSEDDETISVVSEMLPLCDNLKCISETSAKSVSVKIPVVLTECTAAINIESSIKLKEDISEISHISRHVFLNQCKLAPDTEKNSSETSILFIDGFIRENMEYWPENFTHRDNLKYAEVIIPFKCAVRVTFKTHPELNWNVQQSENKILNPDDTDFCENDSSIFHNGKDSLKSSEFFNEKIFCELICTEIQVTDIFLNNLNKETSEIMEKAVLFLTLELLQKQHVNQLKIKN